MKFTTRLSVLCLLSCLSLPSFSKHVESLATVEAKEESVVNYQLLDGQIESVNKSTISAQTSGVISKLIYDVGDYVEKGSEIARISSQNQKAGLQEAQASVGQAKAAVSRAQAAVSKAKASISQAAATVSQAQAALREAQATSTEARLEFDRIKKIYQKRLISKSVYDKAHAAVKSTAARVDAAKANLTATKAAYNASKTGLTSAESDLAAAKSGFNASKAGLSKAGEQLGYTQLLAPYSGIVIERHVELGEVVAAGKPVMTGISLAEMRATANIPQRLILAVRKYKSARIYMDGDTVGIPAKSLTIFPYADPATNGFKVRVALESGIKGLFPGVFVKIGFETGASTHLVIPQNSVAYRGEVTAVYVVDKEGTPHFRQVRLGRKVAENKIQITAGLDNGEKVAVDPVHAAVYLKSHRQAISQGNSHE